VTQKQKQNENVKQNEKRNEGDTFERSDRRNIPVKVFVNFMVQRFT
jgi:hypothetical protein